VSEAVASNGLLDPLRSDPRYPEVLAAMALRDDAEEARRHR
jgi:hypothetical protein